MNVINKTGNEHWDISYWYQTGIMTKSFKDVLLQQPTALSRLDRPPE
jgi:hypothetical protein